VNCTDLVVIPCLRRGPALASPCRACNSAGSHARMHVHALFDAYSSPPQPRHPRILREALYDAGVEPITCPPVDYANGFTVMTLWCCCSVSMSSRRAA
jgi:hypothetical protein